MGRQHSHRHIGDVEELEHMDPDCKFVMTENVIYPTGILAKPKQLGSYSRITVDFPIETEKYSHRYTAVYALQKHLTTGSLSVYSYTNHFTILGMPDEKDLCNIPRFLYVYSPDAKIWEDLD